MRTLRIVACTTLALVSLAVLGQPSVQAQGRMRPGRQQRQFDPAKQMERIGKALNLTDAQKTKIKPILQDEGKQIKALRDDKATPRAQKREKIAAIRKDAQSKIRPLLTPAQLKKLDGMKAKAQERMEARKEKAKDGKPTKP